jgi:basic membrane lipoprotein Med (substrate-binding protein (PBP1-ABC) superfamily)
MRDELKVEMAETVGIKISKCVAVVALLSLAVLHGGCNRSGSQQQGAAQNKLPVFERDLASVQRNNFQKVYVISRPDGAALNADDKAYLKTNMPIETTMRLLTDEDRRLIVGTNFDLKPEHFDALNKRFHVEDYTGR